MKTELEQFTNAFTRAVRIEMDEMKRRLGSFEVPLSSGQKEVSDQHHYRFGLPVQNNKLYAGMECELRYSEVSQPVTLLDVEDKSVRLESGTGIGLGDNRYLLVIYPWFLYERLIDALESLSTSKSHFLESAFRSFGKGETHTWHIAPAREHKELNKSQQGAVSLALGSNLAFIWGPPGTGKTTTLAHVVEELLLSGKRVLAVSTTNAAVDQMLGKLIDLGTVSAFIKRGEVLPRRQQPGRISWNIHPGNRGVSRKRRGRPAQRALQS